MKTGRITQRQGSKELVTVMTWRHELTESS